MSTHPCVHLQNVIVAMGMDQQEFARRVNLSWDKADALLRGELPIDEDIAHYLGEITDVPSQTWLRLQAKYDSAIPPDTQPPYDGDP